MKKDFEKYDKNLKKIKIFGGYSLSYCMGEYDEISNSPDTGNVAEDGYKTIINISFFERDKLDFAYGRIKTDTTTPNDEGETPRYNRKTENFKISYDIAKNTYDYFINEFDKQFPQLKGSEYRNSSQVREIEKGNKPTLGYLHATDKAGNDITDSYESFEDKPIMIKYIENHVVKTGKNHKYNHISYYTSPEESEDLIRDNMFNMEHGEVEKQNLERAYKYNEKE